MMPSAVGQVAEAHRAAGDSIVWSAEVCDAVRPPGWTWRSLRANRATTSRRSAARSSSEEVPAVIIRKPNEIVGQMKTG